MGYRSDIKIICGKKAAADFRKVNKKYNYFKEIRGQSNEWLFYSYAIKWYEGEKEIDEYLGVIKKYAEMTDDKVSHENGLNFLRTGEELDDVERLSNYATLSGLCLTIEAYGFTPLGSSETNTGDDHA